VTRAREVEAAARAASLGESARIVSTLVRVTGDWDLAEDCMQDAFARALEVWERDGIPDSPGAWLTTVARNRAIDLLRRNAAERRAVASLGVEQALDQTGDPEMETEADDRLSLLFTCCHPALPMDARVALTLRTVAGLTVAEIARAFLVSESTMDKRLVRARAKIKNAGIPYRVPPLESRAERVSGVLSVLYLLFNEGYSSTENEQLIREPLAAEAIRLDRMLIDSLGDSPFAAEATGLLALMLIQHARRAPGSVRTASS
jgi:RNA polymerase sigma-70 factor (ECF subfamily)